MELMRAESMRVESEIALLEEIFSGWKDLIGEDYLGYRHHVYRMIHCCLALKECSDEEKEKIIIAAAFHDIGIWIDQTIDYIDPSIKPAIAYLKETGRDAWKEEITLMISEHHKMTEDKHVQYPLVELFRKGDLIDFSFGLVSFGLPREYIKTLKSSFPNAGFHKGLAKKAGRWFVKHPLNPAPMMKW